MPHSWIRALSRYNYPVSLPKYGRSGEFSGYLTRVVAGDRASTSGLQGYCHGKSKRYGELEDHSLHRLPRLFLWKRSITFRAAS
jgi:hypothetical protein